MCLLNNWQNSTNQTFSSLQNKVHVWKVHLDLQEEYLSRLKSFLSEDEEKRAARFYFEKDRRHYIAARGQLKILLGKYLDINPEELNFEYNDHGKPFYQETGVQFNVSHSNKMGLIAFDPDHPIGVDIEWKRPDFAGLKTAQRFFSSGEIEELESLPEDQIHDAFFNGWTRKEAYIKALGKGLAIPLSKFQVTLSPGEPSKLVSSKHDPGQAAKWILYSLKVPDGYAGAVMVSSNRTQVELYEFQEQFIAGYR